MRIAIPDWHGRVSPVFDTARYLRVVETRDGLGPGRNRALIPCHRRSRVKQLSNLGVDCLICGAICRELQTAIEARGIEVVSNACGPVREVLAAFIDRGTLPKRLLSPGCLDDLSTSVPTS